MQQFICVTIILLFAVVNIVQSGGMTEETEKFVADIAFCKNQTGATDEDVEEFYSRQIPTNKTAKCFNKCIFNKMGIFKDGKLSADGLIKAVEMDKTELKGKDGKSLMESMKDIIAECTKVADADE